MNHDGSIGHARRGAIGKRVLVAGNDPSVRAWLGALLRETEGVSSAHEVENGVQAVSAAREVPFDVALLGVTMPRLDGVQTARLLLAVDPSMRLALYGSAPDTLQAQAERLGLPVFDTFDLAALAAWARRGVIPVEDRVEPRSAAASRRELSCLLCGYGIVARVPPSQCPMCHAVTTWVAPDKARDAAVRQLALGFAR